MTFTLYIYQNTSNTSISTIRFDINEMEWSWIVEFLERQLLCRVHTWFNFTWFFNCFCCIILEQSHANLKSHVKFKTWTRTQLSLVLRVVKFKVHQYCWAELISILKHFFASLLLFLAELGKGGATDPPLCLSVDPPLIASNTLLNVRRLRE